MKSLLFSSVIFLVLCGAVLSDSQSYHSSGSKGYVHRPPIVNDYDEFPSNSAENLQLDPEPTSTAPQEAICRQNYEDEPEEAINDQITKELYASHVYMSMSYYFDRVDVALPGFAKFFKKSSDEEREHAENLMKYQNKRGGRIRLQSIEQPDKDNWGSGIDAMKSALDLEKDFNQRLTRIVRIADNNKDYHLADFITEQYLQEQVDSIEELSRHIANLERVGSGLGEYLYDKETLQ